MCNPRRVRITASRDLATAWEREVARTVRLTADVVGEARVVQRLGDSVGAPALAALERALAAGDPDWQPVEGGYRHDVEGGYVVYRPEEQSLEIVAVRCDQVAAAGEASETVRGEVRETITTEAEGRYYDDGYGGFTEERAQQTASRTAQAQLDREARERVEEAQRQAEAGAEGEIAAQAAARAQEALAETARRRQEALATQAREHLETVGLRSRQAFHSLLGRSYREAILAYARRHGAQIVTDRQAGGIIEIELQLDR
jgi:hypothetical protein